MLERESKYIVIGSTALIALAAYVYKKWKEEKIPQKWRRVGTLKEILTYPIKSCGSVVLQEAECTLLGLKTGFLRDRIFMVTSVEGSFVTARTYPKMTQIFSTVKGNVLTLKADGMPNTIELDILDLMKQPTSVTYVWQQEVDTVDCGDEVASWFSRYVLNAESGLRLNFYPKNIPTREIRSKNLAWAAILPKDVGALPDVSAFSLISVSSINDLNTRISKPVNSRYFRNNFVLEGSEPYDEDNWEWVKIGDVIFRNIKPNLRCIMVNIDPQTGLKDESAECLKALKTYRQVTDKKLRPSAGDNPMMGIHLAARVFGNVKVGDTVYVC